MNTAERLDLARRIVRLARSATAVYVVGRTVSAEVASEVRVFDEDRHGPQGVTLTALTLVDAVVGRKRLDDLLRVLDALEALPPA